MNKSVKLTTRVLKVCLSLTFLMLFGLTSQQLQAQQNSYPFNVDLSLGGGLIGNPDANTTFQPELGFSYMPGKFGIGLNAGLLSYDPSFDAQQYTAGFEDYTSVSGSDEKWSSFFFGIGPRFEFGSQLPVTFRSSLDLSLSYNSPPSVSVDFNDPDGSAAGVDLQLSGYDAGEDYSKWSAALRPEFQMQFSPGGSDRFAIQVTTGIQHRLSKNEFTYSQRDLSEVQVVPNSQEMFMQFEMAPEVQRSAHPPQTNFFTTVGIKIKFGSPRKAPGYDPPSTQSPDFDLANNDQNGDCDDSDSNCTPGSRAQDYNSSRSNKPSSRAADISDGDQDSDNDGIDDAVETAQDYNSSRSNKPRTEDGRGGNDEIVRKANRMARLIHPPDAIIKTGAFSMNAKGKKALGLSTANGENPLYEGSTKGGENPLYEGEANDGGGNGGTLTETKSYKLEPLSSGMRTEAQDYNAARSNKPTSRSADSGNGDLDSDDDGIDDAVETAQDYNSSRSNKPSSIADIGDLDSDGFPDLMKNASLIVNRKIKPGKMKTGDVTLRNDTGDADGDGYGDAAGFHFDLEIDPNDPDSDGDGVLDAIESATYSISKRSARTGRNASSVGKEIETMESRQGTARNQTSDIYEWKYNLSAHSDTGDLDSDGLPDLMKNATLVFLYTEGNVHIDLQVDSVDPDDDGDGFGDLLQNSSFSISKRSARTGRN